MSYFAHCSVAGSSWRAGSFIPVLEGRSILEPRPLLRDPALVHPDLRTVSTTVCDRNGVPAVAFGTEHPFATGFSISDDTAERRSLGLRDAAPLTGPPGHHAWTVSTRTPYGEADGWAFSYVVR